MNNNHGDGKNYPMGYPPRQQVLQQPVRPQQPVMQQQPVSQQQVRPQQPVYSTPQPVRPVYQQPFLQQPVIRAAPMHTILAKEAVSSMSKGLFVILSVLFGWIFTRSLFSFEYGVGMTVMGLSFYLIYIPFMLTKRKEKTSLFGWLLFIPQIVILAAFTFYSDPRMIAVGLIASFVIAAIQTTLLSGSTAGKPFSLELICDTCVNYFAMPFMNLGTTLAGIFSGRDKNGKKSGVSFKIAIGAAISLPVVLTLIVFFACADQMFAMWVSRFLRILNLNPLRIFADILFTAIVMLYVMPLVVSLRGGYHKQYNRKESRRFFDPVITATVLFASSVVYLVFVAAQFTYLFAGIGSLPKDTTLAEYSRRGFFELVFVIVITTVIMGMVCMLTRNNQHNRLPVYVKIALLIITLSNVVIIVSAARRLIIYINAYHLTVSRFNAAVLIALMAVVDIVVALRIIFDRLKVSAVTGSIIVLTAAAYCIFNVDGFVAKYNVDQYLSDPVRNQIDIEYMAKELSSAAIPQLERLMEKAPNEQTKQHAKLAMAYLADRADLFEGDEKHIARWTIDRQVAVDIIDKHRITWDMSEEYFDKYISSYSSYRYL